MIVVYSAQDEGYLPPLAGNKTDGYDQKGQSHFPTYFQIQFSQVYQTSVLNGIASGRVGDCLQKRVAMKRIKENLTSPPTFPMDLYL